MNICIVKWTKWDKTQSRELLGLFICVCIALCIIVAHNTTQNIPDNFPSYPPDNHHRSDDVYLREGVLFSGLLPQWKQYYFDHFSEREWVHVHYMLSPVRLSVVCNVRAPYSGGSNFRQYFYDIRYLGHPLTSTLNFTEIVPEEPLRWGVKHEG